ncbi:MAG: hypothetical protein ACXVCP_19575, partial [Bdellovibrio sp.]
MKVSRFKKYLTVGAVIGLAGAAFAGISLDETIKNFLANYDSLTASMNYDLYKNEKARCPVINEQQDSSQAACRTAENKEFFQIGTEVLVAQFKQSGKWIIPDTPPIDSLGRNTPARVFHAKQHACLTATVKVMPSKDRVASDSDLKSNSGLYANNTQEPISYKAVIRFSSGQGRVYSDWLPDVKGMAIKVFNVKDEVTGEVKDADLLMTSGPNPLGRNLRDFADFMNAAVNGPLHAKSYISSHQDKTPKVTSINVGESLAAMRFWSGHPYLLGNISNRSQDTSMKFNVTSHSENGTKQITFLNRLSSENFLREDLKQRLTKNGKLVYDLNLQLEKDEKTT